MTPVLRVLLFFIAMAASALLANALFHLIPQALGLTGAASEKYDETMVIIFAGFYGFYVVGKILDMSKFLLIIITIVSITKQCIMYLMD